MNKYTNATEVVWCQEEPKNQGAWYQILHHFKACITENHKLYYVGRAASASPAAGYLSTHRDQQNKLVEDALADLCEIETNLVEAIA